MEIAKSARETELSDFDRGIPRKSARFQTKPEADLWARTYASSVSGFGARVEAVAGRLGTGFPAGDKTLETVHQHCSDLADMAVEAFRFRKTKQP